MTDKCFDLMMKKNDECEELKAEMGKVLSCIRGPMTTFHKLNSAETIAREILDKHNYDIGPDCTEEERELTYYLNRHLGQINTTDWERIKELIIRRKP
jgi:hypothetical protein